MLESLERPVDTEISSNRVSLSRERFSFTLSRPDMLYIGILGIGTDEITVSATVMWQIIGGDHVIGDP